MKLLRHSMADSKRQSGKHPAVFPFTRTEVAGGGDPLFVVELIGGGRNPGVRIRQVVADSPEITVGEVLEFRLRLTGSCYRECCAKEYDHGEGVIEVVPAGSDEGGRGWWKISSRWMHNHFPGWKPSRGQHNVIPAQLDDDGEENRFAE